MLLPSYRLFSERLSNVIASAGIAHSFQPGINHAGVAKSRTLASALLRPFFTIPGPSAFDLRDFRDSINRVARSCLEPVPTIELRLLAY